MMPPKGTNGGNTPTLGEILLEKRMLTAQQLNYALGLQQSKYGLLGEILLDLGFVNEDDVIDGLTVQLAEKQAAETGTAAQLTIRDIAIPAEVVKKVPRQLLLKHHAIPVRFREQANELTIAMIDVNDVGAQDELRFATSCQIVCIPATRDDIEHLWRKYLDANSSAARVQRIDMTGEFEAIKVSGGSEKSTIQLVDALIARAVGLGASDVHFDVFSDDVAVRFRIDGVLYKVLSLPHAIYRGVISRVKIMGGMDISEKRVAQEGRTAVRVGNRRLDLRISVLPVHNGERTAIRIMERAGISFDIEKLGVRAEDLSRFRRQIERPNGLILVTGPTGSGKTTTLYAMLNHLNDLSRNIVTIEDPVEYVLTGFGQVQVDERGGFTHAAALRAVLRHDPNVIMVGEIRDEEAAQISARAALTGHLVLATVHTNDAATAVARFFGMGVQPFLLASCLNMTIAQRLVRRICPQCRVEAPANPRDLLRLGVKPKDINGMRLFVGRGCTACSFTGYKGRLALFETLTVSNKMRELITKEAPVSELRRQARRDKVASLALDGLAKAQEGLTSLDEVMRHTYFETG